MVDTSLTGMRCRATKEIRSHQGLVRRYSEGIIQYDMENLRTPSHQRTVGEWCDRLRISL